MADTNKEKDKAVELAVSQIDKQFGKGSIMRLGEDGAKVDVPAIPTGCLSLDAALGVGGFPRGRISEIYGPESSGKTTLALHIIAEAQKRGGYAAFVDAEHALDVLLSAVRLAANAVVHALTHALEVLPQADQHLDGCSIIVRCIHCLSPLAVCCSLGAGGFLQPLGSLSGYGFLISRGSLTHNGVLPAVGSLFYSGFLILPGSLIHAGFLSNTGSLLSLGFLVDDGSL